MSTKLVNIVLAACLLGLSALIFVGVVFSHGATGDPIARVFHCYLEGPESPDSVACSDVIEKGGTQQLYDWNEINISNAAGNHQAIIPDGKLCSAGREKYAAFDEPRTDWPRTIMPTSGNYTFLYHAHVPHNEGYFELWVTKDGYDPTQPLAWDDIEMFARIDRPPLVDNNYVMDATLPEGKSGHHVIYIIWQRNDSGEAFYSCSDVWFGSAPTPTPTTAPACAYPAWNAATSYGGGDWVSHNNAVWLARWGSSGIEPSGAAEAWRIRAYCDSGSGSVNPTPMPTMVHEHGTATPIPTLPIGQNTPTPAATSPSSSAGCSVNYSIVSQWDNGFQIDVIIANNGSSSIDGWDLTWTSGQGEAFSSGWNATFASSGRSISVSNPSGHWNGTIAANGGIVKFGFMGSHTGSVTTPTDFAVNGISCNDESAAPVATLMPIPIEGNVQIMLPIVIVEGGQLASANPPTDPVEPLPTLSGTATPVMPTATPSVPEETPVPGSRVQNPFQGANSYLNPNYVANVMTQANAVGGELGAKMALVADIPSAVWMDRIGAIYGSSTKLSLEAHLDAALSQQVDDNPMTIMVVVYDLPNRDCASEASNGELRVSENGLNRYKSEYIDPIADIFADPKYSDLRIVAILEPDSLPNLVTNTSIPDCQEARPAYIEGIQYAIDQFDGIDNVYTYLDIGHAGWLGWDSNFGPAVTLYTQVIQETEAGFGGVDGFVSNTSGYTPISEPYLPDERLMVPGTSQQILGADFYEWNPYLGEVEFVTALREAFIANGFPEDIGMLVDTSRNGWGGADRPAAVSSATNLNSYVDQSRIDRRPHRGGWCNQTGAGIGARPAPNPAPGLDAFVWVKPPGESDGISDPNFTVDPDDPAKRHDPMCDPSAQSSYNNAYSTNALEGAPHAGRWFSDQFQMLVENAYPPLGE
ncbi:MAG: glycoside hydrolase family 6 protein [Chloroflexota bacterium]